MVSAQLAEYIQSDMTQLDRFFAPYVVAHRKEAKMGNARCRMAKSARQTQYITAPALQTKYSRFHPERVDTRSYSLSYPASLKYTPKAIYYLFTKLHFNNIKI